MLTRLQPSKWTLAHAAHLLCRAGFGGNPEEIAALYRLGSEGAVKALLEGEEDADLFPPPALTQPGETFEAVRQARRTADEPTRRSLQQQIRRQQAEQIRELRTWWMSRMRESRHPLREKMTLFWHGHFATSFEKVRSAYLMWQQNETFRAHALGNFASLTKEISKDPAMMRYLDTAGSNKANPNENFARELLELFMLGEGVRYSEQDIRQAARAFTGYRVDPRSLTFAFQQRNHDSGEKEFMGRRGDFSGDDIIDIVAAQPECSEFLARKLWIFFASENPSPSIVLRLSERLRSSHLDLRVTMKEMFLSEEFYSPSVVRSQVKSPVQWLVQTSRVLEAPLPSQPALEAACSQMGQIPFAPPNVKGWDGGRAWISSATLLLRYNLAGYIVSGKAPALDGFRKSAGAIQVPLRKIAPDTLRASPEELCDAMAMRLLNAPIRGDERSRMLGFLKNDGAPIDDSKLRDFLHLMMSTPDFQLT